MGITKVDGGNFAGLLQIKTTSVTEYVLSRTFSTALVAKAEKLLSAVAAKDGSLPILEVAVWTLHLNTPQTGD
jgi:hypothetical protein